MKYIIFRMEFVAHEVKEFVEVVGILNPVSIYKMK